MAQVKGTPSNRIPEIKTGDTVVVLHGKDAGKRGKVDRVLRNRATEDKVGGAWRRVSSRPISVVILPMKAGRATSACKPNLHNVN